MSKYNNTPTDKKEKKQCPEISLRANADSLIDSKFCGLDASSELSNNSALAIQQMQQQNKQLKMFCKNQAKIEINVETPNSLKNTNVTGVKLNMKLSIPDGIETKNNSQSSLRDIIGFQQNNYPTPPSPRSKAMKQFEVHTWSGTKCLPPPLNLFINREKMPEIKSALVKNNHEKNIFILHGLNGMGKATLATQIVYETEKDTKKRYDHTLYISIQTNLMDALKEIIFEHDSSEKDISDAKCIKYYHELFSRFGDILVYIKDLNNPSDIKLLNNIISPPDAKTTVLVTSKIDKSIWKKSRKNASYIEISEFSDSETSHRYLDQFDAQPNKDRLDQLKKISFSYPYAVNLTCNTINQGSELASHNRRFNRDLDKNILDKTWENIIGDLEISNNALIRVLKQIIFLDIDHISKKFIKNFSNIDKEIELLAAHSFLQETEPGEYKIPVILRNIIQRKEGNNSLCLWSIALQRYLNLCNEESYLTRWKLKLWLHGYALMKFIQPEDIGSLSKTHLNNYIELLLKLSLCLSSSDEHQKTIREHLNTLLNHHCINNSFDLKEKILDALITLEIELNCYDDAKNYLNEYEELVTRNTSISRNNLLEKNKKMEVFSSKFHKFKGKIHWLESENVNSYTTRKEFLNKAIDEYELAINDLHKHPEHADELISLMNGQAVFYCDLLDKESLTKAQKLHESILKIKTETTNTTDLSLSATHNNLGCVYYKLAKLKNSLELFEKALDHHSKSLKLRKKINQFSRRAMSHRHLGRIYYYMSTLQPDREKEHLDYALENEQKALEFLEKSRPKNERMVAATEKQIARILLAQYKNKNVTDLEKVKTTYQRVWEYRQRVMPEHRNTVRVACYLASVCILLCINELNPSENLLLASKLFDFAYSNLPKVARNELDQTLLDEVQKSLLSCKKHTNTDVVNFNKNTELNQNDTSNSTHIGA